MQEMLELQFYQAAVSAESLQEMVELANQVLGRPILIADSIHNILAISKDVAAHFGGSVTWKLLMEHGWLPSPPKGEAGAFRMPLPSQLAASEPVKISSCVLPSGEITYLCDLRDNGHIIMKLAVMAAQRGEDQRVEMLAKGCYLLYFRLIRSGTEHTSGRGNYIHSLLQGKLPTEPVSAQWLGVEPPYLLFVFPVRENGVVELSISNMMDALKQELGYGIRSTSESEQMVLLFHAPEDAEKLEERLNAIIISRQIPMGISAPFFELSQLKRVFSETNRQLQAAMDFCGFSRCAMKKEFGVFQMFELVRQQDTEESLLHPDAGVLWERDRKHGSHDLETLFCWLYYEKNAAEAAKHVFVHRNTLDNRIAKISERINANWNMGGYCTAMLYSAWVYLRKEGWLRDAMLYLPESIEKSTARYP